MATSEGMWYRPVNSVWIWDQGLAGRSAGKRWAIFDLDGTIIRAMRGRFFKDPYDYLIYPGRREALTALIEEGWEVLVVTNQNFVGQKLVAALQRIQLVAEDLDLPIMYFIATKKDDYRKPKTAMWELITSIYGPPEEAYYVGDAAGRPADHSDSDLRWAENVGLDFFVPEDFFAPYQAPIEIPTNGKWMAVLVGEPGSGKSTWYANSLKPLGYQLASKDLHQAKTLKVAEGFLQKGQRVAIDNTNPTQAGRAEYYALAQKYGYSVIVYVLLRAGEGENKLRPKPVPQMAYNMYFSRFEMPTITNTPGPIVLVPP